MAPPGAPGLTAGEIAGAVLGALAVVALSFAAAWHLRRRDRSHEEENAYAPT